MTFMATLLILSKRTEPHDALFIGGRRAALIPHILRHRDCNKFHFSKTVSDHSPVVARFNTSAADDD